MWPRNARRALPGLSDPSSVSPAVSRFSSRPRISFDPSKKIVLIAERLLTRYQETPDRVALPGWQGVSPRDHVVNRGH